ncbi:MAG: hypothetical protein AAF944_22135 [Bacteroidota bacterium]
MSEKFLTFRRFNQEESPNGLIKVLEANDISYIVEDSSPSFDVTFSGSTFDKEVHIKIKPVDFEIAEKLLLADVQATIDQLPPDYYLLNFTNEELIEVLMKPDKWSATDYKLSQEILKERGKVIDDELINTLKKKRNEELSEPEKSQRAWIYAGYLFSLLGGILGIFIGWHLMTFKKTLPNGHRVYGYVNSDRKHGKVILILGFVFTILWLIVRWNER